MRVRMQVDISGDRNGQPWPRYGKEVDLPDSEGADLCAAGMAVPVKSDDKDVERAVPAEDAVETRAPAKKHQPMTKRSTGL